MHVDVVRDRVAVIDPDICTSLDLRVSVVDRAQVDAALRASGLGRWAGDAEAELDVAGLHAAAQQAGVAADWPARWDAMIAYAARKGWLSADGLTVRAHLVDLSG